MSRYITIHFNELDILTKIHMLMFDILIHCEIMTPELKSAIIVIRNELTKLAEIAEIDLNDDRNKDIIYEAFFSSVKDIVRVLNTDKSVDKLDPWILQNIKTAYTNKHIYKLGEVISEDVKISLYEDMIAQENDLTDIVAFNITMCFKRALKEESDFEFIKSKPMCWTHNQHLNLEQAFNQPYVYNRVEMYRDFRLNNMIEYIRKLYSTNVKIGEL